MRENIPIDPLKGSASAREREAERMIKAFLCVWVSPSICILSLVPFVIAAEQNFIRFGKTLNQQNFYSICLRHLSLPQIL